MKIWDIVVVGGGPVGLLLGCRLSQLGLSFVVLEGELERGQCSRAIGIHPPGLVRLEALGLLPAFLAEGVRIERAQAWSSRGLLGRLDLTERPGALAYSLSIPQPVTERLLEERLNRRAPGAFRPGHAVSSIRSRRDHVELTVRRPDDRTQSLGARWVVGCDGRRSVVRQAMALEMRGSSRPESYLMADVADDTAFGTEAAIFLADEGLVESFPLPGGMRRWVAQAPGRRRAASVDELARLIAQGTGHRIRAETAVMSSAFGIEQRIAPRFFLGRGVLAGDAAHVVSPIGAQGMNLGWIGAWRLAGALERILRADERPAEALGAYERAQRQQARRTMQRAALNGLIGRRKRFPRLRNAMVRRALEALPGATLASLFTMAPLTLPRPDASVGVPARAAQRR